MDQQWAQNMSPKMSLENGSENGSKIGPKIDPNMRPKWIQKGVKNGSKMSWKIGQNIHSNMGPIMDPKMTPKMGPKMGPKRGRNKVQSLFQPRILVWIFPRYLENSIANEWPLYLNFLEFRSSKMRDGCEMQIWNFLKCSFCSRSSSWGFLFWISLSSPSKRFLTKAKSSIFVGIWIDERIRLRSFAHWSWISKGKGLF